MDQKQEIRKCEDALKVLWILKGTRVAYDALTGNAPWWWSVQKNDLSHKQKILSEEATFNILTHISQDLLEETRRQNEKKAKAVQTQIIVGANYNKKCKFNPELRKQLWTCTLESTL